MDNLEDKIGSILSNPQLMQQIMSMAQSIGQTQPEKKGENFAPDSSLGIDISTIQKLSQLASQSEIDSNQQALLSALSPYLSQDRVSRLERAMRAAKIARYATAFIGTNVSPFFTGR